MKPRNKTRALAAMLLVALAASQAGAQGDDTAAEIRFLKARLKQLEDKVARQEQQVRGIAKLPKMAPAPDTPIACKDQPCPPPPPPVFVSFTNGLKVESFDQAFSFKIGGRVFVDGGVNSRPVEAFPPIPALFPAALVPFFPAHPGSGFSNQAGIRQARLQAEGTAFKWWDYKMQYDFAGSANSLIGGGVRDAFLLWRYFDPLTFEVGNFFEPFSLARYSVEDGNPASTGAPAAGSSSFLAPVPGGHQYWDASGRLTYAPILTEESLLHIGGSIRYQKPNDATAASDDRVLQPGSQLRSEANILNEGLLGTQPLTCVSAALQLVGQNCVTDVLNYSAEAVASFGPFSIQGEYIGMHYDRDATLLAFFNNGGQHAPGGTSINFSGYYAYVTWYLTGESRAASYKQYSKDPERPGTFGQTKILNPVSAGGLGAWELAARFSTINLNDGSVLFAQPLGARPNIQGGRQTDFTLGLNWYPDVGIRFMANWVNVLQYSANYNRPDLNGIHPQLFVMRAQVNW